MVINLFLKLKVYEILFMNGFKTYKDLYVLQYYITFNIIIYTLLSTLTIIYNL